MYSNNPYLNPRNTNNEYSLDRLDLIVRRLNPPFQLITSHSTGEANNRVEIHENLWPALHSNFRTYGVYLMIGGYILKAERVSNISENEIYLNYFHRKMLKISPGISTAVYPYKGDLKEFQTSKIILEVGFLRTKPTSSLSEIVDSFRLIQRFKRDYRGHILKVGQQVAMDFEGDSLNMVCEQLEPSPGHRKGADANKLYGMIDDNVTVYLKAASVGNCTTGHSNNENFGLGDTSDYGPSSPSFRTTIPRRQSSCNARRRPSRVTHLSGDKNDRQHTYHRTLTKKRPWISGRKRDRSTGGQSQGVSLWNKDLNLEELGIGGLDEQFKELFRRAFISRLYPSEIVEQCGVKHVKGVILYGPPGTGKTLLARKIGDILDCDNENIRIVNGPELLNCKVGQSEENVRNLFAKAEQEYIEKGEKSNLHLIILDEMDALCKARGTHSSVAVHDGIVNQLLTTIDGINSLNNILVIGMTNRLDLLDEALLRPGRFELQLEINLPKEDGRFKILKIHTKQLSDNDLLDQDVDLNSYAKSTINFTGAELEALVKNAVAYALTRHRDYKLHGRNQHTSDQQVEVTVAYCELPELSTSGSRLTGPYESGFCSYSQEPMDTNLSFPNYKESESQRRSDRFRRSGSDHITTCNEKQVINENSRAQSPIISGLTVNKSDFDKALKEIKPAFGYQSTPEELKRLYTPYGLVAYSREYKQLEKQLRQWASEVKAMKNRKASLLLMGQRSSGTTALATITGLSLETPFFRMVTPDSLIGLSELEKCRYLESVFRDAEKSESSTILLDSLERLVGYCEIGHRYQGETLQTLVSLISSPPKSDRKLAVIATFHSELKDLFTDLIGIFSSSFTVPMIESSKSICSQLGISGSCGIKTVVEALERSNNISVKKQLQQLWN